jgi:hypothetical protein
LIQANDPESADIDEAEIFARKTVRIVKELKGPGSQEMIGVFQVLVKVIFMKDIFTDETKGLLRDHLNDALRYEGVSSTNVAYANCHLRRFPCRIGDRESCDDTKRQQLQISESYYKEASRLFMKLNGPNHPQTLQATSNLSYITMELEHIGIWDEL